MRNKALAIFGFVCMLFLVFQGLYAQSPEQNAFVILGLVDSSLEPASGIQEKSSATEPDTNTDESSSPSQTEQPANNNQEEKDTEEESISKSGLEDAWPKPNYAEAEEAAAAEKEIPEIIDTTETAIGQKEAPLDFAQAEPEVEAAEAGLESPELGLLSEIENLVNEKSELYARIYELEIENDSLKKEAHANSERIMALETSIAEMEGLLVKKDEALALADARLAEIEALLAEEGLRMDAAMAAPANTDERIAALELKLAAAEAALEKAKAGMDKDFDGSMDLEQLQAQLAAAEQRVSAISAERDAAIKELDSKSASLDAALAAKLQAEAALEAAMAAGVLKEKQPGADDKAYLRGWSLDTSRFTKLYREGFDGSLARMGTWKINKSVLSQTDASQYFSRLEMPLAQGRSPLLYSFKARSGGKGWVGLGLHFFVEDIKKKRGYGEGRSLLVWFTRDRAQRGDDATYIQLYRSDNDVVMERMFDAELADGIEDWHLVEIVYDPGAEYIAVAVDNSLRIVYKTFFGRDSGATVSLRTLGAGAEFSDFSVYGEGF